MIRGTTAPFKFDVPYAFDEIDKIIATFWQKHNKGIGNPLPIKKMYIKDQSHNDGFAAPDNMSKEVHVSLNPEETLRFSDKEKAYVQIQVYYGGARNVSVASVPQKVTVYPVFNDDAPIIDIEPSEIIDDIHILDSGEILGGE